MAIYNSIFRGSPCSCCWRSLGQRRPAPPEPARRWPRSLFRRLITGAGAQGREGPKPGSSVAPCASPPSSQQPQARDTKTHLVVLVHGLFGSAANWRVIAECLEERLERDTTLLYISTANEFAQTFTGVDMCGERLADEIRGVVARHPRLERLTLVGHSMGGLIARFAAGRLFDPHTRTMCGLRPCHYISMATPHLGCDGQHTPAQVPLVGWAGALPAIGGGVQSVLRGAAVPFASLAFGRAGAQFFLVDRDRGHLPLLVRMTQDQVAEGCYFLSALECFETRTCYANSSGDHLVGWANSSLRSLAQLPRLRGKGRGVVREDPLDAAWHPKDRPPLHLTSCAPAGAPRRRSSAEGGAVLASASGPPLAQGASSGEGSSRVNDAGGARPGPGLAGAVAGGGRLRGGYTDGPPPASLDLQQLVAFGVEGASASAERAPAAGCQQDSGPASEAASGDTIVAELVGEGAGGRSGVVAGLATAVGAAAVGEVLGAAAAEGARVAAHGSKRPGGSGAGCGKAAARQADAAGPQQQQQQQLRPGQPRRPLPGGVPPGATGSLERVLVGEVRKHVGVMLGRLQALPWRRVDVCFGAALLPFLSHQHIQVQRKWINFEGLATAKHLAAQLAAMEEARLQRAE